MTNWFNQDRPVVFFDLETTGPDIRTDRIVEIAILRVETDGSEVEFSTRVNPGIPIPPETSDIHGITDADIADSPRFEDIAADVERLFDGADCSGYNIRRFDLPLLTEELKRVGKKFSLRGRRIIDPMIIFQQRNPRSLGAAYRHYCGEPLEDAHSALADCRASYEVLKKQFENHSDLPSNPDALHRVCNSPRGSQVDPDGVLKKHFRELTFSRGKFRGKTVKSVAEKEPGYIRWMVTSGVFSPEVEDRLKEFLEIDEG